MYEISDVADYVHAQIGGRLPDVLERALQFAKDLEYDTSRGACVLRSDDAVIVTEEIGACPDGLSEFVKQKALQAQTLPKYIEDTDVSDLFEFDAFVTCDDLIHLARSRGAKIEAQEGKDGGHAKITLFNREVVFLQNRDKSWSRESGRKTILGQFKRAGIRASVEDSNPLRYCGWCKQFNMPEQTEICKSTHFSCLRVKGDIGR